MGSSIDEQTEALIAVHPTDKWRKIYIGNEGPQHPVVITKPFYLAIHEVTQRQYETVMGNNPSVYQPSNPDKKLADKVAGIDAGNLPVDSVTWEDAMKMVSKMNEKVGGLAYRLPTDAEWEFACRAGTTEKYWTGSDHRSLLKGAWIIDNSEARPHAVGLLLPNPFGFFDTHGNVWEWVQDAWREDYYKTFVGKRSVDPCCTEGPDNRYIQRGGDWTYVATHSRSSVRAADYSNARQFYAGVRLAMSLEAVKEAEKKE